MANFRNIYTALLLVVAKATPRDEQGNPVTVHALFDNFEVHPGEHINQSIAK